MIALIDADHIAHRSYHALSGYTGSGGQPAGIVYGFLNSLKTIGDQLMPRSVVICWGDKRASLWRRELLPSYKAHRSETESDFVKQVNITKALLAGMGLGQVLCPSFEADDIIGALCRDCVEAGREVGIVSGDHDMFQLVRDEAPIVRCFIPIKGVGYSEIAEEDVVEKFGIPPKLLPMFMALKGEKGDGVPGVPGIGKQRAKDYLLGKASSTVVAKIEAHKELIDLNLRLVSLMGIRPESLTPSTLPVLQRDYDEIKVITNLRKAGLTGSRSVLSKVRSITEFYQEIQARGAHSLEDLMRGV